VYINQNIKALHLLKIEATQAPGIVLSLYSVFLCYLKISHFLQIFTRCPTLLHFPSFPFLILSHLSVLPLLIYIYINDINLFYTMCVGDLLNNKIIIIIF